MILRRVRANGDRLAGRERRLLQTVHRLEGVAEIEMCAGQRRVEGDGTTTERLSFA